MDGQLPCLRPRVLRVLRRRQLAHWDGVRSGPRPKLIFSSIQTQTVQLHPNVGPGAFCILERRPVWVTGESCPAQILI